MALTPDERRLVDSVLDGANHSLWSTLVKLVVEQLGVNSEQVCATAAIVDDLGADELDQIELVMAIEEEFGAAIPEEDVEKYEASCISVGA